MKKNLVLLLFCTMFLLPVASTNAADTTSETCLKNNKHFAIMNPFAESVAQSIIKQQIKKETGANFNVKLDGYTLHSLKKGIFKNLELVGKKVELEGVFIPYIKLKTVSEYNWIDYTKNPPIFKTDMNFAYQIDLSEKSLNNALDKAEYQNFIKKVNTLLYPIMTVSDVNAEIKNNRVYITMGYVLPLNPFQKMKKIVVSTEFKVINGKVQATNIATENSNFKISLNRLAGLINLLNPLDFTLSLLENKNCEGKIENINIIDNIIRVNGKIFVKGD